MRLGRQASAHTRRHTSACREPTIYALSSAPGRAAVAVIRASGPACLDIHRALCPGKQPPPPRVAAVRTLHQPGRAASRESILDPSALLLFFPAPKTVTGEDVLELHVHGGPAIVKAVLAAISTCADAVRYAEPGEFTRRAFMNRRLDLTQVEALGHALSADTEQQRRLSVRGTAGTVAKQYEKWRQMLLSARGELEALIDFSEDQHFDESPAELMRSVARQVGALRRALEIHGQNAVRGELLRHGIGISLLGAPNAGKSSLLNRIVGREAAIVSTEAGTTRDVVEVGVDIGGYFCRFGDTAGLRQAVRPANAERDVPELTINQVEQEGMRRAKERAAGSDLVIVVFAFEPAEPGPDSPHPTLNLDGEVTAFAHRLLQDGKKMVLVLNKSDLLLSPSARTEATRQARATFPTLREDSIHLLSCIDAAPGGIQPFLHTLITHFADLTAAITLDDHADADADADPSIWQASLGASERHRTLLDTCVAALDAFLRHARPATRDDDDDDDDDQLEPDLVLAAEHLRAAAESLAQITGRGEGGGVEEVLGVVFEKFCVGK